MKKFVKLAVAAISLFASAQAMEGKGGFQMYLEALVKEGNMEELKKSMNDSIEAKKRAGLDIKKDLEMHAEVMKMAAAYAPKKEGQKGERDIAAIALDALLRLNELNECEGGACGYGFDDRALPKLKNLFEMIKKELEGSKNPKEVFDAYNVKSIQDISGVFANALEALRSQQQPTSAGSLFLTSMVNIDPKDMEQYRSDFRQVMKNQSLFVAEIKKSIESSSPSNK